LFFIFIKLDPPLDFALHFFTNLIKLPFSQENGSFMPVNQALPLSREGITCGTTVRFPDSRILALFSLPRHKVQWQIEKCSPLTVARPSRFFTWFPDTLLLSKDPAAHNILSFVNIIDIDKFIDIDKLLLYLITLIMLILP
jgi:hypothetical protein